MPDGLDQPKLDLESYIANYTGKSLVIILNSMADASIGRSRFERLFLIGTCSTYLSTEALKLAVAEAKLSKDISRYEIAVRALGEVAPNENEASVDTDWVDRVEKGIRAETDRLEQELRGYKNNLIKESIRVCTISPAFLPVTDCFRWETRTSGCITIKLEIYCPPPRLTLA